MDKALMEASLQGDVRRLNSLLSQNPILLQPFLLPLPQDTPLHVASQAGHAPFVQELLRRGLGMARVPNNQGMCAIHLAAACGHADVVIHMLVADRRLAHAADKEGRCAIHVAAACNQVQVMDRLIEFDPNLVKARTKGDDETVLHVGVRYGQLDAVKFLMARFRRQLFRDRDRSSVLQLAKATGNKVILMYLSKEIGQVSMSNTSTGFLGMGKLDQARKEKDKDWFREKLDTILIVASVVAGATFQTGIQNAAKENKAYRFCNTVSFGLAMVLFVQLASGGSLTHWVQTRISLIILLASLFFMALSYGIYILHKSDQAISKVAVGFMIAIITIMLLAFAGHVYVLVENIANYRKSRRRNGKDEEKDLKLMPNYKESPSAPLASK